MRKGLLLTLGVMVFCLMIIALSMVTLRNAWLMKHSFSQTASVEAVKQKFSAVEIAMQQVWGAESGVNFSFNSTTGMHIVQPMLPNFAAFESVVNSYDLSLASAVPFTLSKRFSAANMTVMYARQDSPYSFVHYNWFTPNERQISLDADALVPSYEFRIYSPQLNGSPAFVRLSPGTTQLTVTVLGKGGYSSSVSAMVNPFTNVLGDSMVSISGYSNVVNVSAADGRFRVNDFLGSQGNLTVEVIIGVAQKPSWYLPSLLYVQEGGVVKNGSLRIF